MTNKMPWQIAHGPWPGCRLSDFTNKLKLQVLHSCMLLLMPPSLPGGLSQSLLRALLSSNLPGNSSIIRCSTMHTQHSLQYNDCRQHSKLHQAPPLWEPLQSVSRN